MHLVRGGNPPECPEFGGVPRREAPFGGVPFGGVSPPQAENFGDLGSFGGVPAFRKVIRGGVPTLEDTLSATKVMVSSSWHHRKFWEQ